MKDRQERLAAINAELSRRGLKAIDKLGDVSKGEIEALGIKEVYDHSQRFFTDVKFDVLLPGGKPGEFTVRFNANGQVSDGAVMVVLVNGQFAIVKQWRLPLGRWTYEVPRGFGEKLDKAQIQGTLGTLKVGDLPLGTLSRELGEEVMANAEISSFTYLGNIAENSGTSNVIPSYFLVQLQVDADKLQTRLGGRDDEMKVQLWSAATVRSEIGRKLCDNHTITALFLALRHIESLSQL